jgi:hypothetical protein
MIKQALLKSFCNFQRGFPIKLYNIKTKLIQRKSSTCLDLTELIKPVTFGDDRPA